MRFCDHHGVGVSLLKSSSYLMFESGFNRVRDFILNHSKIIVQDDAGIPIDHFNRGKWNIRLFGNYVGPIEIFKQYYQPKLHGTLQYEQSAAAVVQLRLSLELSESHLIVATRN